MNMIWRKPNPEKKVTLENYVGYTAIEIANNSAFCILSSYLAIYCSDILGIPGAVISAVMIIAKIWDCLADPIVGSIVQKRQIGKKGKYRPLFHLAGYPLALVTALIFVKVTDNLVFNIIWVALLYVLYGTLYTFVSVPYGSLANIMTQKAEERSSLSMCRSIGGGIGIYPTLFFPVWVMTAGADQNQMDAEAMTIGMAIVAFLMFLAYTGGYNSFTEEPGLEREMKLDDTHQKTSLLGTFKRIIKNKTFVIMCCITCIMLATQMYINTVTIYLFKDYFQNSALNTVFTLFTYLPMILFIPFSNKLITKVGKKEASLVGLIVSTLATLLLFVLPIGKDDAWIFIVLSVINSLGVGFATVQTWSFAADIIDHDEWVTGVREEAADFAFFTFMRKIGQAIASLAPWIVSLAGYDSEKTGTGISQGEEVLNGMYDIATLVPFILRTVVLVLMIIYPLNKKTTEKMHKELAERRIKTKNA